MSYSRDQILNNISQNTVNDLKGSVKAAYQQLVKHDLPKINKTLIENFEFQLASLSGQVTRIQSKDQIPAVVENHIKQHQLRKELLISNDSICQNLSWSSAIKTSFKKAEDNDQIALSCAYAGVAETGSIVMVSSPNTPTTHNFLVSDHIVLLKASRIVSHLETVWREIQDNHSPVMPRTINVLTGPSRTGDVEQTIQLGAHGPIRFHVIILLGD